MGGRTDFINLALGDTLRMSYHLHKQDMDPRAQILSCLIMCRVTAPNCNKDTYIYGRDAELQREVEQAEGGKSHEKYYVDLSLPLVGRWTGRWEIRIEALDEYEGLQSWSDTQLVFCMVTDRLPRRASQWLASLRFRLGSSHEPAR